MGVPVSVGPPDDEGDALGPEQDHQPAGQALVGHFLNRDSKVVSAFEKTSSNFMM